MRAIALVVEDVLSETIGRIVIRHANPSAILDHVVVSTGYGDIKRRIRAYNTAARVNPYVIITDLDRASCPSALISEWLGSRARSAGLVLRVAVREIEAWLMADRLAFAKYLGIAVNRVHSYPEQLLDPKAEVVRLAVTSAKRDIRRALTPIGAARQGPDHNGCLSEYALHHWSAKRAIRNSRSLERAVAAISHI